MVNTSCQLTFLSKYIFCPFRQAENYFSLCTCCVDDLHFITWALWWAPVLSKTTWASSRLILCCVGLKHILTSLCYSWWWQAAITHKAPRQDSCLVNSGYDYAHHSLRRWKQFLSWFTGLIGPDPWVCWPLTNQENSRGGIHYSVSPLQTHWLQHNLSRITFSLKHEDLEALSQCSSARAGPEFSESILALRLV